MTTLVPCVTSLAHSPATVGVSRVLPALIRGRRQSCPSCRMQRAKEGQGGVHVLLLLVLPFKALTCGRVLTHAGMC